MIREGLAKIDAEIAQVPTKDMEVFYNPVMELNRTTSIILIKALGRKLNMAFPLAGTGIRPIRIALEAPETVKEISINDLNKDALERINDNLKLNNVKATICNKEADLFLLESKGFDYIDIDPFGSPVPFIDTAIKRISRGGILAITATDTGALSGSFPKACKRRYFATPSRGPQMHEYGLRILARRVQLQAAQYGKALTPIFSYSRDHYMRVIFECQFGKQKADQIIKQHKLVNEVGPIWTGQLWDTALLEKMVELSTLHKKFLEQLLEESKIDSPLFHPIHAYCKEMKSPVPKFEKIMKNIEKLAPVCRTHFALDGIRTTLSKQEVLNQIKLSQ